MIEQQADVADAFTEWRDPNLEDVQPIVQILAERLGKHVIKEETIRRRDHSNVDSAPHSDTAHTLNLAGFQESQEQALHAKAHLPDFIEEYGSSLRVLQQADAIAIGARETSALVAKKFGFEEAVGNGRAVDCNHRAAAAPASGVNQSRGDFLSDPAFPRDQNLGVGSSRILYRLKKLGNRRTGTDDVARFGH